MFYYRSISRSLNTNWEREREREEFTRHRAIKNSGKEDGCSKERMKKRDCYLGLTEFIKAEILKEKPDGDG